MNDPVICYRFLSRPRWSKLIRGAIPDAAIVGLARTLADYGTPKGQRCYPGLVRLAEDMCCSTRTVQRQLAWLTEYGFFHLAERGNKRAGKSDEYWVALPAPIAASNRLWQPEHEWWIERPAGDAKHRALRLAIAA